MTTIETERLRLRPITPDDVPALHAIYAHPDVERWIGPHLASELAVEVGKQIALQEARGFSMFALEDRATGELLGDCGLQPLELKGPEIEIGWDLAPHAWGRGYATEAARAVLARAFAEPSWGLDEVIAVVDPANSASQRVAEKAGMTLVGERPAYEQPRMLLYAVRARREGGERDPASGAGAA
jgi:RimJ/RimL family protein N-acetyltransferase